MRPNSESSVAVPGDRGKCPCTLECPSPGFHSLLLLFLLSASVTFTAIGSVPVWHCTALLPLLPLLPCSFLSVTYLSDKWCVCVYLFVLVHLHFWYCFRTGGGLTVMIRSRESLLLAPVPRHLTSSSSASCIEDRFVSAQRGTHSAACVGLPDCRTTGSKYSAAEVAAVSYWRQPSALSRCRSACTLLAVLLFLSL